MWYENVLWSYIIQDVAMHKRTQKDVLYMLVFLFTIESNGNTLGREAINSWGTGMRHINSKCITAMDISTAIL